MTADKSISAFNLPFNQATDFWLALFPPAEQSVLPGSEAHAFQAMVASFNMQPITRPSPGYLLAIHGKWSDVWQKIASQLKEWDLHTRCDAALVPGDTVPAPEQLAFARKPANVLTAIAESLWLGEAMLGDHIVCYMQPVLDKRGKIFGYEAFARVETDGEPIGGGKIIAASRALNAEYMLDRHLHVKAVTSFIQSDLEGFLFINFVPGFIHRPEKYLEGLSEAARFNGMPAKQIVLDFAHTETERDLGHYKSIFEYCRSKGYSLSLDDISTSAMARRILDTIRPDFLKLDIDLVRNAQLNAEQRAIADLVSIAHAAGATVIAEGVETEEIHRELLRADIDLFQGYLFSPPVAISSLKKAVG